MRRLAWRLFCPCFAAFFGCISLLGQGLHSFVAHDFHGHCAHACHDHVASEHHAHASEHGDHADELPELLLGAADSHASDNCPICDFFAQAQPAVVAAVVHFEFAHAPATQAVGHVTWVTCAGVYQSRAPPAGLPV